MLPSPSSSSTSRTASSDEGATEPHPTTVPGPTRLLRILALAAGILGLGVSFLIARQSFPLVLLAPCVAFLSGAVVFRRFPAADEMSTYWSRKEAASAVEETPETLAGALKEANKQHQTVLDALGAIVIKRAGSGEVLYVNEAAERAFHPEDVPRLGAPLSLPRLDGVEAQEALRQDPAAEILLETRHGPRWFSILELKVSDGEGGEPILQTILRDVTYRRQAEDKLRENLTQAASANEAKSRFMATVSHEIRTPLNGILGMAGLLRDTPLSAEQRTYVEAVRTSGEALLVLIDEVLDYSKIEADKLELRPKATSIDNLVEGIVELLAPKAHAKGLQIGSFVDRDLPHLLEIDEARVRQILLNLAGNGIKFTETGGVSILAELGSAPSQGAPETVTLRLSVVDTGPGFTAQQAQRIFNEFEQLDDGRTRKHGGTGLGLSISKRLTEMMGGRISACGKPGAGAAFTVDLPVTVSPAPAGGNGPDLTELQVAILAQGATEAPLIARRLRQQGASVTLFSADDPDPASLKAGLDLVILCEGAVSDTAEWLARARTHLPTTKLIVLVAPGEREKLPRLREQGCHAYLVRPVRTSSLLTVVDKLRRDEALDALAENIDPYHAGAAPHRELGGRSLKFLVAEDNEINRLLTGTLLKKMGHEVHFVGNGEEAVSEALSGAYDAVLMDLHMPGIDGLAALQQIRTSDLPNALTLPIIVLTADVMPEARATALDAGASGFITKPLDPADLANILDQVY